MARRTVPELDAESRTLAALGTSPSAVRPPMSGGLQSIPCVHRSVLWARPVMSVNANVVVNDVHEQNVSEAGCGCVVPGVPGTDSLAGSTTHRVAVMA